MLTIRALVITAILIIPWVSLASPYVASDPACYDATGASAGCPSSAQYSMDGGVTWQEMTATVDGETIAIHHDLSGFPDGENSLQVRWSNLWGVSDAVPFVFTKGAPVTPSGVRLSLN